MLFTVMLLQRLEIVKNGRVEKAFEGNFLLVVRSVDILVALIPSGVEDVGFRRSSRVSVGHFFFSNRGISRQSSRGRSEVWCVGGSLRCPGQNTWLIIYGPHYKHQKGYAMLSAHIVEPTSILLGIS
jgi:hypothetical protein